MKPRAGEHYRMALTVFSEPERLWQTVTGLLDAGLGSGQICIVASVAALGELAPSAIVVGGHGAQLNDLYRRMQQARMVGAQRQIVASEYELLARALEVGDPEPASKSKRTIAPAKGESDFKTMIADGFVGLVVSSSNPSQQLLVTRALLGNSNHRVTTYERPTGVSTLPPDRA